MVRWLRAVVAALPLLAAVPAAADNSPLTRQDVETIVREYLIANPEVLEEAFAALQSKRLAAATQERSAAIAQFREELERSPYGAVIGNPDGDVTLVEFFDYNCGFCRRALSDLDDLVAQDPNLRVVLKEFPVLGEASMKAAAVSIAVHQVAPDKYADFHTQLLEVEGRADDTAAFAVAEALAIPRSEIDAAMASDSVRKTVEESYRLAKALQLDGTPSYVVGDAVEEGAVGSETLKSRINVARCGTAIC